MRLLELFSGTASLSTVFRNNGHEAITVDNNHVFQPDICRDITDFEIDELPDGWVPDIVWASPPCESFSVATIGRNWNKDYTPKTDKARIALDIVKKTLMLIPPSIYFLENPRGMLRKMSIMRGLIRQTVTYCQYGDTRMKPTDIWTNSRSWIPRPICRNGDTCHEAAPRGSKTGTQGLPDKVERGRLPEALCKEIMLACESELRLKIK